MQVSFPVSALWPRRGFILKSGWPPKDISLGEIFQLSGASCYCQCQILPYSPGYIFPELPLVEIAKREKNTSKDDFERYSAPCFA